MPEVDTSDPIHLKVNPRKWTTKVNIAVTLAVLIVLIVGVGYAIYIAMRPEEVHEELPAPAEVPAQSGGQSR